MWLWALGLTLVVARSSAAVSPPLMPHHAPLPGVPQAAACPPLVNVTQGGKNEGQSTPVDLHLRLNLLSAGSEGKGGAMPMLAPDTRPILTWELPFSVTFQEGVAISLVDLQGATVYYRERHNTTEQNATLMLPKLAEATVYSLTVSIWAFGSLDPISSEALQFFTALRDWAAKPVWVAPCASGGASAAPDYAWLRSTLPLPPGDAVQSALAFVSAEAPLTLRPYGCCEEIDEGSKILAAYKLQINGQPIGIGPGRPRCGAVAQGACQQQTPYDGFSLHVAAGATQLMVEIHAYGQDQPTVNLTQRVIFQLVLRMHSGKVRLRVGAGRKCDELSAARCFRRLACVSHSTASHPVDLSVLLGISHTFIQTHTFSLTPPQTHTHTHVHTPDTHTT